MAVLLPQLLVLLFSLFLFNTYYDASAQKEAKASSRTFLLPIVKDTTSFPFRYLTSIELGTPPVKLNLIIDIAHQVNWLYSTGINPQYNENTSSTERPYPCSCVIDRGNLCYYEKDGCFINMCAFYLNCNVFDNNYNVYLIRDLITLYQHRQKKQSGGSSCHSISQARLPNFSFGVQYYSEKRPVLEGFPEYISGVMSLSRSPLSLNNQLADYYKIPRKLAICLPSSTNTSVNGVVYFGGGPYILPPSKIDLSTIMLSTDFITINIPTPPRYEPGDLLLEYMFKITSIEIGQTKVQFDPKLLEFGQEPIGDVNSFDGGSKLNPMIPYTSLISDIYWPFIALFAEKAEAMNITRVDSSMFTLYDTCFNSTTIRYDKHGAPQVPIIDFIMEGNSTVLHNKRNRWRVYGSNSMVNVMKDVVCLAFTEGRYYKELGAPLAAIMIGGKQMEDNLIEFDQDSLKLKFNAFPLSKYGTSCSQFKTV